MVIVAVLLVSARVTVHADEQPAPELDPDSEVAQREFRRGIELYDRGRYDEAIAAFQAANAIKPRPAFDSP
jgi:hypothetical protein